MDTPALAIAQSLWWRNRRSFIASAATLAVMAAVYPLLFAFTRVEWVLAASTLPLGWCVRRRMERPLIRRRAWQYDVALPALHAHIARAHVGRSSFGRSSSVPRLWRCLWVVTAALVYNTSGFAVPILLPALGCAAMMAWLQVLAWTPIASQWIRPIVTLLWMSILAAFPMYLLTLPHRSFAWFGPLFVGYIAAAFPLGLAAVASQRRGDRWRVWPQTIATSMDCGAARALPDSAVRLDLPPQPSFGTSGTAMAWSFPHTSAASCS